MFERLTEAARQVVLFAHDEALRHKRRYIHTEHLLIGLLRQGEGVASDVLDSQGLAAGRVRDVVVRLAGSGTDPAMPIPDPFTREAFAPAAENALVLALRESLRFGHDYIGAEHILLGVVRREEHLAGRVLLALGADRDVIRDEVIRRLPGPGPAPAPRRARGEPEAAKLSDQELEEMIAAVCEHEERVSYEARVLKAKIDILRAERDHRRRSRHSAAKGNARAPRRKRSLDSFDYSGALYDGAALAPLATLVDEVGDRRGRPADAGDLLVLLASIPNGVAAHVLAALGADTEALTRAAEEARRAGARSALLPPAETFVERDTLRAETEAAIEAQDFDRAAVLRDRQRTLIYPVPQSVKRRREKMLAEVRVRLGLSED